VIVCEGLTKRYGTTVAVDGLDLDVGAAQVYGFLGPNGAGKTTTIRMLVGLVAPSGGRAFVNGRSVPDPTIAATSGSMIEDPRFYPWMSGRANLEVLAATGTRVGRGQIDEALGQAGLTAVAGRKVKAYSQGMRQRLGLAAALLRRPRLLILDEPTNGLDPEGIHEVRELLRQLAADGGTVFVSSHLLAEVEQVADRAAVVVRGRLVEEGPVSGLGAGRRSVRVVVDPADRDAARTALVHWPLQTENGAILVRHGVGRDVNAALVAAGVVADTIEIVQPGLEERYLELTREESAGAPAGG
ncbi:MAG: type transport system ATP-binding protein, partial [Actinomycetota bacterium]|nr:type transport system ATP-binding protein [Actinomycetota bacterium]